MMAPRPGLPPISVGPRTRKENLYGSASALPSIDWNELATVTVYVAPGLSAVVGVSRIVTGSRHSVLPGIDGSTVRMLDASMLRSSDPATGRSKVTLISASGDVLPTGAKRMTRSGAGVCAP